MNASYHKYILKFKKPSGTSRGILRIKETWFLTIEANGKKGIGECGILRTLSADDVPGYEEKLKWVCENIKLGVEVLWEALREYPSIQFGVEMAFASLHSEHPFELYPSSFTRGKDKILINGLIWMGDRLFMKEQIQQKIAEGFDCIKMKIGAIDFKKEIELLQFIRSNFSKDEIELRVDANGAFLPEEAMQKLTELHKYDLHSIEQPIKAGQVEAMETLCSETPLPIALDEELIGVFDFEEQRKLLEKIKPQFIILKPSLIGGIKGTNHWISQANCLNIKWWITSALESNIGLNAIAQYTYSLATKIPQGLGTGGLYLNNIESPLFVEKGMIGYDPYKKWKVKLY